MKVIGSFLIAFLFLGSPTNAQESTSSSVHKVEKVGREEIRRAIEEFEGTLRPSTEDLLNKHLERLYRQIGAVRYAIEIYFDFRDAPYFTGRSYGDRLFGAEKNWEIVLRDGEDFSDRDVVNIASFSLGENRILGKEGSEEGNIKIHTEEWGIPNSNFTISLVERDPWWWFDDFYFIDLLRFNDSRIDLGNHSYIEISSLTSLPVDR